MKARKRLASLVLALLMALTLLPAAALADDWENTTDVKNYEEFAAALEDEKVEEIKIVGEVTIPETKEPIETDKPILVAKDGKLTFAPGAEMHSSSGMGKFWFEDNEKTWDLIPEMCEMFLLWTSEEEGVWRDIRGTQGEDLLNATLEDPRFLSTAVLSGGDVSLEDVDWDYELDTLIVAGHNFTLGKDVSFKANNTFKVDGDFIIGEGASVTLENGGVVTGNVICADEKQVPENLEVGGEVKKADAEAPAEAPAAAPKFTDVAADSPFAKAIDWAVAEGITNGKTETTFGPGDTCTISHILTFLWRANGKPGAEEGVADRDCAAKWAKELKLIGEQENVDAPCTRLMAVSFMWRAAGDPTSETEINFTDVDKEADYAPAIAWAVEQGVTTGTGDGTTFSPGSECTRGQIVTFLFRAANAAEQAAEN